MEINHVTIVGLGALGILYAGAFAAALPKEQVRILADRDRILRYKREGIYRNDQLCDFRYVVPGEEDGPADLILIAVKYEGLSSALEEIRQSVGPDTCIISLLNGIRSETEIAAVFGWDSLLLCVAQGMDAVKEGNHMNFTRHGILAIGDVTPGPPSERLLAVSDFFQRMQIPYETDPDMRKRMWGKFMLNVGVNQTVSVFETDYGGVQREGAARDTMIAAMREVLPLAQAEGIDLTEDDICYWLSVVDPLSPTGKPSMRQDTEAKRKTEVALFAGTVIELSTRYGLPCPVNRMLYDKILEMESSY